MTSFHFYGNQVSVFQFHNALSFVVKYTQIPVQVNGITSMKIKFSHCDHGLKWMGSFLFLYECWSPSFA